MYKKHFENSNKNLATIMRLMGYKLLIFINIIFTVDLTAMDTGISGKKITKVMIDAGHGGRDPGNLCTKRYKKTEKDLALEVSLKVGQKLKDAFPEVEVLYTRTTDVFLELHERTALANKNEVDLFISIHCDAADNKDASGSSTYVIGPAKTDANLKRVQKENAVMLKEKDYLKNYSGFDPYSPESYIEMSLLQNSHARESISFAQSVQNQFKANTERKNRGVKHGPWWVISYTKMPSVLIELGFTTNAEEEDFIRSASGQGKLATSIVNAFGEYKKSVEIEEVSLDYNKKKEEKKEEQVKVIIKETPKTEDPIELEVEAVIEEDDQVYFKVQIATSSTPLERSSRNFKGLKNIEVYESGGLYKYTCGKEKSYKKARALMNKVKGDAYPGAFVVAFKGNARIDLADAILQ